MYSKTYSAGEVINALEIYNKVRSLRKAANITGIGKSTIQRWRINLRKVFQRKDKRKRRTKRRHKYPCLEDLIKNLFRLCPADLRRPQNEKRLIFMHLKHIQNALKLSYNIVPSLSLLHRTLKQCKISRRRFNTHHVNASKPSERNQRFLEFQESIKSLSNDEIVCLDEVSFCNIGNPCYGYFQKGKQPEIIAVPRRERISLVMVVHSLDGIISYHRVNKAFNKTTFIEFLNALIPKLPSQTKAILMDNVAFHKSKEVVRLLESHRIIPLYIPPYSPRCNPIEEVFSLLKRAFRTQTTKDSFIDRVQESIDILKPYKDITNLYRHTREYVENECQTIKHIKTNIIYQKNE